jgi:hypothetical protein
MYACQKLIINLILQAKSKSNIITSIVDQNVGYVKPSFL